ncbi:GGDEF domain-containing protein [Cohnella faecalis]|uniref:GGDEF domain-containing protein n=1 Tax=Cohnella faecalis TaxID=2315694 RepID=A0A398CS60_9BACL|nr:GGDEF domain-containing protein [Cohnella faecalis]
MACWQRRSRLRDRRRGARLVSRTELRPFEGVGRPGFFDRRLYPALSCPMLSQAGHESGALEPQIRRRPDRSGRVQRVNDKLGHEAGDGLLCKVARTLREQSTLGEIVGRIGGDEFLVLCPYGDSAALEKYGERLNKKLIELSAGWNHHPLSMSIGYAVFPEEGRTLEQLMRAADCKMYADKQRADPLVNRRMHA